MIILGVDPGSIRTGYGAIDTDGRRHRLLEKGILAPPPRLDLADRLRVIHAGVAELIARLRPAVLAVEDVFHSTNTRTALVLGHVRGVVLLAGAEAGLAVQAFPSPPLVVLGPGFGPAEKAPGPLVGAPPLGPSRMWGAWATAWPFPSPPSTAWGRKARR